MVYGLGKGGIRQNVEGAKNEKVLKQREGLNGYASTVRVVMSSTLVTSAIHWDTVIAISTPTQEVLEIACEGNKCCRAVHSKYPSPQ